MADVIEAIHKITYEVNDEALLRATNAIKTQVQELTRLNKSLLDVQQQLERTGKQEVARIEELTRKIEELITKITVGAGKAKGLMEQLGDGFLKAAGAGDGLSGIVEDFVKSFIEGIPSLLEGSATIGEIAAEVFSFSNIVTASIAVIGLFISGMSEAEEKTADYGEAVNKAAEYSKELGEEAGGEISKLVQLKSKVEDATLAYNKRLSAANELRDLYPSIFGNLSNEAILTGKVGDAYERTAAAIIAAARARILGRQIDKLSEEVVQAGTDIDSKLNGDKYGITSSVDPVTNLKTYNIPDEYKNARSANLNLYAKRQSQNAADGVSNPLNGQKGSSLEDREQKKINESLQKIPEGIYYAVEHYNSLIYQLGLTIKDMLDASKHTLDNTPKPYSGSGVTPKQTPKFDDTTPFDKLTPLGAKELPVDIKTPDVKPVDVDAMMAQSKKEEEEKDKAASEKRKERVKEMISEYQNFAQEAIKAINAVYDAQIKTLDKEIELRKDRVSQAKELAKRGNAEVLKSETDQLEKAQAAREKKAKQQMQLNALLQVSNQAVALSEAIGAIVAAAAHGDPYTIALRVAAAVAALVAGIASLSGAFSKSNSFADGVVDYKGKGGPRDDANWVRISTGESVITADGTKKHRHLLEAINNGKPLQFANPALAYTMPVFATPQASTNGYASKYDLSAVEGKLDSVVNAIEDNRLKQNIYFNEHGVGIMTERAMRKDRKRWM